MTNTDSWIYQKWNQVPSSSKDPGRLLISALSPTSWSGKKRDINLESECKEWNTSGNIWISLIGIPSSVHLFSIHVFCAKGTSLNFNYALFRLWTRKTPWHFIINKCSLSSRIPKSFLCTCQLLFTTSQPINFCQIFKSRITYHLFAMDVNSGTIIQCMTCNILVN